MREPNSYYITSISYIPLSLVLVELHLGADESVVVAAVVLELLLAEMDNLRAHAVHEVLRRGSQRVISFVQQNQIIQCVLRTDVLDTLERRGKL